ncbi:MAG: N-6 DNA methylase, partial [Ktedonobacteraceae bacterium]
LANNDYHRIASLKISAHVETLVQQIKQVLGSLRETIRAQFTLLQQRYYDYQELRAQTHAKDTRPFKENLQAAIEKVVQFGTAFRMDTEGLLRDAIMQLLTELAEHYLTNGDISTFESEYLLRAAELFSEHQINQASFIEKKATHTVRLSPPVEGLSELKVLLQTHYTYLQSLDEDYALSKKTIEAYDAWKTGVRGVFSNPQDEFCLQTAYIHFVRLFFVRVCEDHSLIARRISDGPFARYEQYRTELLSGIKDTYLRLLEETYQRASSVYHNFFDHQRLFDWFLLDEYTILALFDLLNRYDFAGLSADVLGRVYNEGYIETKDRSERGQFYTPPWVVDYMLDSLGVPAYDATITMKGREFLEKTVGDLSCGSGTFLVAAAARKSALLQKLVTAGEIDPDYALQLLTGTFLGFDLNPFACYLAEINLLIQCLPFLLDERGQLCRSVERFHIYCTNSLEPTVAEQAQALFSGKATERLSFRPPRPRGQVLSEDERNVISIKGARGLQPELTQFDVGQQSGIDYLFGNPPYVSAGESPDNLRYRSEVWSYGIYHLLHQRWDLFVPFFERNLQFLRPDSGRLGLIVSNGIETEGYAERLRQLLSHDYTLLQIDFFPRLRLFQDAAVENTIVLLENHPPDEEHEVIRRRHLQADCTRFESIPPVPQVASNGQVFRWRYDPILDRNLAEGTVPLCGIVYVGTGIVAQSKESLDPVIQGRRQKLFTLDDIFLPPSAGSTRPAEYTEEGVIGNDVDRYYLRRKRYVAYEKYRDQIYRPRHRALFRTAEKLLLGETSGGYYDREGLFTNHSVQVVVPWSALERAGATEEKGIKSVLRESQVLASIPDSLAPIAELFDLRYLLGIINSAFIRRYIAANMHEGTRQGRVYPDIWKRLPIKVTSTDRQQQIATLVDAIQGHYRQLAAQPTTAALLIDPALNYRDIQGYIARGELRFVGDPQSTIAEKPVLKGEQLIVRHQPLAYLESSIPALLRYLELYLTQLHANLQGWTWVAARKRIEAPATLADLQRVMAMIDQKAEEKQQLVTTIASLLEQVEILVEAVYQEPADADLMSSIRAKQRRGHNTGLF